MEFTALPRFSGPEAVCTPMGNLHSVATSKLSHLSDIWPNELGIEESTRNQASNENLMGRNGVIELFFLRSFRFVGIVLQ